MIVWRITGNEIGDNGNGAAYYTKYREAERAIIEHARETGNRAYGPPEKIRITNRAELAAALNDAMGYGAS